MPTGAENVRRSDAPVQALSHFATHPFGNLRARDNGQCILQLHCCWQSARKPPAISRRGLCLSDRDQTIVITSCAERAAGSVKVSWSLSS